MEVVGFTFEQFEECWYKDSKREIKALFSKRKRKSKAAENDGERKKEGDTSWRQVNKTALVSCLIVLVTLSPLGPGIKPEAT